MRKYSEQFKLEAINKYLSGTLGMKAVADEAGVGVALLKRWVAFYRAHGAEGIRSRPYVRYSAEFKLKVLRHMWDNHLSLAQAAAAFDVRGQCNIANWQRSYLESGTIALMPASEKMPSTSPDSSGRPAETPPSDGSADTRTKEQLLEQIEDLQMEVAYLKKLRALIQSQQAQQPAMRKKRKR